MSVEKEIPFVIFLKSIYEVRPKKHPTSNKTHHWKLRIETLKSPNDIKRVEFVLHDTFPEPVQVIKKPPFEIEEEGFGNFEMQINIKILNRKIPLPYFIHLLPQKDTKISYHHSVWMVKPNELAKVLDIGGVPMEKFDNEHDEMRALTKVLDYVKRCNDKPLQPSLFFPRAYEKVVNKIKRMEAAQLSSSHLYNAENDIAHSDDSSSTRLSHVSKSQKSSKHNLFDRGLNDKPKVKIPKTVTDFNPSPKISESHDFKKEMKRKKNYYDSSSDSESNVGTDSLFDSQKRPKKSEHFAKTIKQEEIKHEKSVLNRPIDRIKHEAPPSKMDNPLKSSNKLMSQSKPKVPITSDKPNHKQHHGKDSHKLKLKLKENTNNDSFNKLFEAQDILVVNRNKQEKIEPTIRNMDSKKLLTSMKGSLMERPKKNLDPFNDEREPIKKSKPPPMKQEERVRHPMKDGSRMGNPKYNAPMTESKSSKMKLPEKTMPEPKKSLENENTKIASQKHSKQNLNAVAFPRTLSRSSSSDSDHGSAFSKSSSDNEIDHEMFKPKKKSDLGIVDQTNVGVRQLFGDDKSDASDDDDDEDDNINEMDDIFGSLKSSKKPTIKSQNKQQSSLRGKSDDDNSSDNDRVGLKDCTVSRSQSPESKSEPQLSSNIDSANKGLVDGLTLSYKDRRRLAKQLIKINDKDFFEKLQRLLLTSYRNKEKSLRFDVDTMKLDFHMGEISDKLALIIKSMVDEFFEEHQSSQIDTSTGHDF